MQFTKHELDFLRLVSGDCTAPSCARPGVDHLTGDGLIALREKLQGLKAMDAGQTGVPSPGLPETDPRRLKVLGKLGEELGDGDDPDWLAMNGPEEENIVLPAQPPEDAGKVEQPALTVWYGSMPESNGRENWTAELRRVTPTEKWGQGFCFARSEYPERVRYEADRMRWIIGELAERPDILAYDADKHSGYVEPTPPAAKLPEQGRGTTGTGEPKTVLIKSHAFPFMDARREVLTPETFAHIVACNGSPPEQVAVWLIEGKSVSTDFADYQLERAK